VLNESERHFDIGGAFLVLPVSLRLPVFSGRKRWDWFVKYLLGAKPPADYEMIVPPPKVGGRGGRGGATPPRR
jgi:hypothetical protein